MPFWTKDLRSLDVAAEVLSLVSYVALKWKWWGMDKKRLRTCLVSPPEVTPE